MRRSPNLSAYYRVDGGDVGEFCEDWRRRAHDAKDAFSALAEKYGAPGYVTSHPTDQFLGILPVEPIPEGWEIFKYPVSKKVILRPANGPSGDAVRAEIDALPKAPETSEIEDFLGIPRHVTAETLDGRTIEKSVRTNRAPTVDIGWGAKDGVLLLRTPDPELFIENLMNAEPGCKILEGRWTPPEGLTRISRDEFVSLHQGDAELREQQPAPTERRNQRIKA